MSIFRTCVAAVACQVAAATLLPSFHASSGDTSLLEKSGRWHVQIDDTVFHAPEASSELSPDINNYYYAIGSTSGVPADLKSARVGGEGRYHIFHVPHGSMLQTMQSAVSGDRRSSMSTLSKLRHGATLTTQFPEYMLSTSYAHPLSDTGKEVENGAVSKITEELYMGYLQELTSLGTDGESTRSYENDGASHKSVEFLQDKFKGMGYASCVQSFKSAGRDLVNVIGYAPGQVIDSIVVGAHYDSRPFSGPAPGAEDNGSGVAGLLAMAKAFKLANVTPQKSVYFVGFAGEEPGLLGSRAFANELNGGGGNLPKECLPQGGSLIELQDGQQKKAAIAAIVMDEIGWVSPSFPKTTVNLESYDSSSDMMDHMVHACRDHNGNALAVVHNNAPFGSDHMSFLDNNMVSVLTINGDDEAYPHYHQSTDTIENVNGKYGSQITKMNMGALLRMTGINDKAAMLAQTATTNLRASVALHVQ